MAIISARADRVKVYEMITVISNPRAGSGRGIQYLEAFERAGRIAGSPFRILNPTSPDETTEAARDALQRHHLVVACGGDGTVQAVVSQAAGGRGGIGILPAGRGNDFARAVGIPISPPEAAAVLFDGVDRDVDVGVFRARDGNSRYFCTVATCGIDADVARDTRHGSGGLSGRLAYVASGLRRLRHFRPVPLRITGAFGTLTQKVILAGFGNTPTYGGGIPIAPGASLNDGSLSITVVESRGLLRTLALLPPLLAGRLGGQAGVHRFDCPRVEVLEPAGRLLWADGEPGMAVPVTVEILPRGLQVRVPRSG